MPRKRNQVNETASELREIETRTIGTRQEPAIRMLRFLEEDPDITLGDVASMLNRPDRTVRRWWRLYTDHGIEALVHPGTSGGRQAGRLAPEALAEFRARASQEGFPELKDAQRWLAQEFGVEYSLPWVSQLLRSDSSYSATTR